MLRKFYICITIISVLLCGCDKEKQMSKVEMNPKFHNLPPDIQNQLKEQVESGEMDISEAKKIVEGKKSNPFSSIEDTQGWSEAKSQQAQDILKENPLIIDGKEYPVAESGYCARGVANMLLKMGYPVTRGDAHNWDDLLPAQGWAKIDCSPEDCPAGTILQYESNVQKGLKATTAGEKYGHVELVTTTKSGGRQYCSSDCYGGFGGGVEQNFDGAWIYKGEN